MAAAMLATMCFAFEKPANAYPDGIIVDSPHVETYFVTSGSPATAEIEITIRQQGYYIIQTMGFSYLGEYINTENDYIIPAGSISGPVAYAQSGTGYESGCLVQTYLYEYQTYTLSLTFSDDVPFGYIAITNAEGLFYNDRPLDDYYSIISYYVDGTEDSFTISFPFSEVSSESKAMVCLLIYSPSSEGTDPAYTVSLDGCQCAGAHLIDPRGHDIESYGNTQVIFDLIYNENSGTPIALAEEVPYYMVVFFESGSLGCEDHDSTACISITFEKYNCNNNRGVNEK